MRLTSLVIRLRQVLKTQLRVANEELRFFSLQTRQDTGDKVIFRKLELLMLETHVAQL